MQRLKEINVKIKIIIQFYKAFLPLIMTTFVSRFYWTVCIFFSGLQYLSPMVEFCVVEGLQTKPSFPHTHTLHRVTYAIVW